METRPRILISAFLVWIFLASGCVQPLGPGFHFADRRADILVSGGAPGRIHLKVTDQLLNAGDRTLHSLEVRLPEARSFGEQNLRVLIDGKEVSPQHSSKTDSRRMSAPFDPPWERNAARQIVTEWDLMPEPSARGTIAASENGFYIADETALPLWQTPNGVFAKGNIRPNKALLTVFAPPDFRVLAPGKPLKSAPEGSWVAHPFLTGPHFDFFPYIVAGRYQEKIVRSRAGQVQFWTFGPIADATAQNVADRLSASMKALTDFFGPATGEASIVRIVEAPVELPPEFSGQSEPGGVSIPEGALLDPRSFAQGIADDPTLQLAEYELARTWYGWRVRPQPEAQILMGRGVGLFGLVVIAESRGQAERRRMIESLMERYDAAREIALDKRLMEPPAGYSHAERVSTGYRAALFFVALEDVCGEANLKTALRDIIRTRAASSTGYEELRAAAESASGKDLAEMFRTWLVQPGIPEDFRARYGIRQSSNHKGRLNTEDTKKSGGTRRSG
ncbi:MAG TPA: hypothetical protein VGT24_03010 [Candidatus Acidoferrales bacterium]|nr:hypothetical protein [Candidatus Acidoferrales bacterium]